VLVTEGAGKDHRAGDRRASSWDQLCPSSAASGEPGVTAMNTSIFKINSISPVQYSHLTIKVMSGYA